jgi:uncharacterized membrane protein
VLPTVGVEKDGIFVEIGLLAKPTRVFVETYKKVVGFQGICLGKIIKLLAKRKLSET